MRVWWCANNNTHGDSHCMHTHTMGIVGDKLTHDTVNPDTTCTDVVLMYNGCGHGVCDDAVGSKVSNRRAHPVSRKLKIN